MQSAQELYCNTNHRDFAINFKSWSDEVREELNLIHQIQILLNQILGYENRKRNALCADIPALGDYLDYLKNLISTYKTRYAITTPKSDELGFDWPFLTPTDIDRVRT